MRTFWAQPVESGGISATETATATASSTRTRPEAAAAAVEPDATRPSRRRRPQVPSPTMVIAVSANAKDMIVGREVVIVGGGIAGISLAQALAARDVDVTVLDRDLGEPRGSTAYAPGFVGLYNDAPILTRLARASAAIYDAAGSGFRRSGGLELATSDAGAAEVERRVDAARAAGLPVKPLAPADLPASVASFVDIERVMLAGHFLDDGSADVGPLIRALRADATARGARLVADREVTGIEQHGPRATVHTASGTRLTADDVVLACGVWGPSLTAPTGLDLPLFPVAHPYVYGGPAATWHAGPFVRWPEHHVYARVHGDRLGIGSYDHRPVPVGQDELADGALLAWPEDFDPVIASAQRLLRPEARFLPERHINGIFAMTPDNLPFLGRHPTMDNVWIAQALWITHAAGATRMLAEAMLDGDDLPGELAPTRFAGADPAALRENALRLYRDIYANDADRPRPANPA
jgi:glycine/D-amino acid oxidase-like deaminating enzyme